MGVITLFAAESDLLAKSVLALLPQVQPQAKVPSDSRSRALAPLRLPVAGVELEKIWMRSRLNSWQADLNAPFGSEDNYICHEWGAWERGWLASRAPGMLLNGPAPFDLPLCQNVRLWPIFQSCGLSLPALLFSQVPEVLQDFCQRWPMVLDAKSGAACQFETLTGSGCWMGLPHGVEVSLTLAGTRVVFHNPPPMHLAEVLERATLQLAAALSRQLFSLQLVCSEQAVIVRNFDENPHLLGFEQLTGNCQQQIAQGLADWLCS